MLLQCKIRNYVISTQNKKEVLYQNKGAESQMVFYKLNLIIMLNDMESV